MKKTIFIVLSFLICMPVSAQVTYDEIRSAKLNTTRQLKIKLPKDYDADSDAKYPLIIVFDGDYMFEPVSGQADFQAYFDDMPSSIIVGVIQGNERIYDGFCDEVTGFPKEFGLRFHDFVAEELIPYLDNKYNTSKFRVAVGHDLMANFINSYLFKDNPLFKAYVSISPDLSGNIKEFLDKRLGHVEEEIFYYMATSINDLPEIRETVLNLNDRISKVENQNLTYYFDDFNIYNHFTMVGSAISSAFDKIFELYTPLREKELREKALTYEGTLDDYLLERYERIDKLFGIKKNITEEDIDNVVKIAEQRNDLESLQKIGKLAKKLNPESLLGTYYLAQYAEKIGKTKKAKKLYESALELNDVSYIDRDFIFSKIDELTVVDNDNEVEGEEVEDEEE